MFVTFSAQQKWPDLVRSGERYGQLGTFFSYKELFLGPLKKFKKCLSISYFSQKATGVIFDFLCFLPSSIILGGYSCIQKKLHSSRFAL